MTELPFFKAERGQRPGAGVDSRLDWWREAKFGMFIHWGLYSIPAGAWKGEAVPGIGEWIMLRAQIPVREYETLAQQFNPIQFNADQIVALAKRAGQKYLVFTAKHHDGFCMYKSQHTRYNIVDAAPYGQDVVKALAEACQREGVRFGLYYSQTQDWHHSNGDGNTWDYDPSQQDFDDYIQNYVKPQVTELLTQYGPIALIWFDTPKGISRAHSQSLLDLVHTLQPDCLVCGRVGNAMGDYATAQDNAIPPELQAQTDWETPATINDTWGYKTNDHNWKPSEVLIRNLVDIVSKGGNYLLNIGPDALGAVPEPSIERLEAIGEWMNRNSEAIYGARPGPVQGLDWCRTTQKGSTIYLHLFAWPDGGQFVLPDMPIERVYWLDSSRAEAVTFRRENGRLVIECAQSNEVVPVLCLQAAKA